MKTKVKIIVPWALFAVFMCLAAGCRSERPALDAEPVVSPGTAITHAKPPLKPHDPPAVLPPPPPALPPPPPGKGPPKIAAIKKSPQQATGCTINGSEAAPPPRDAPPPGHVSIPARTSASYAVPEANAAVEESQRIDLFIGSLKKAAYTFNPPSPIKVNKPVTVYLWLDPSSTPEALKGQLQRQVPEDAARIEAGITKWSPLMEAALTGDDFTITPVTPTRQPVSSRERTEWCWSVTPKHPGGKQRLHITLNAVMPDGLKSVTVLEKFVDVRVTWEWFFNTFVYPYWKEILGGLGTAISGLAAWWWRKRRKASAPHRKNRES